MNTTKQEKIMKDGWDGITSEGFGLCAEEALRSIKRCSSDEKTVKFSEFPSADLNPIRLEGWDI